VFHSAHTTCLIAVGIPALIVGNARFLDSLHLPRAAQRTTVTPVAAPDSGLHPVIPSVTHFVAKDDADPVREKVELAKKMFAEEMEKFRAAVGNALTVRVAEIEANPAEVAYHRGQEAVRKAVLAHFDRQEEAARRDGDKKRVDAVKTARIEFHERGALPVSLPEDIRKLKAAQDAGRTDAMKRMKALEEATATRDAFEKQGEMPGEIPVEARKIETQARTRLEAAYELAIKEYTRARRDDDAEAMERELEMLKPATTAGPYAARQGPDKARWLKRFGGDDKTEAAVGRALSWLAKQQNRAGHWEFDGSQKGDKVAATGMCLLPFLAAGETHTTGRNYKKNVAAGIAYLQSQLGETGQFKGAGMYTQAIGTLALCETAGMTGDDKVRKSAAKAVGYIVRAQAGNGSWGYSAGQAGDTSIVGWQIQALQSARFAGIPVPDKAFRNAESFLESVSDSGATYGYRTKVATATLTAVGLLCRQYISKWDAQNPLLARGVDYLWKQIPPQEGDFNMYYYYYATQVVHFFDGPAWHRDWNPKMRDVLLKKQVTDETTGARAAEIGSWLKDNGFIGSNCGKVGTTALACLTLEVYYRHATATSPKGPARADPPARKEPTLTKDPAPMPEPVKTNPTVEPKSVPADAAEARDEKAASGMLALVRPLLKNPDRRDFALQQLRQVVRQYPKTEAAQEAQKLLKQYQAPTKP
jgi:hypothetical protein